MCTLILFEDTRQQRGKHTFKHRWWDAHGVRREIRKLDYGDYALESVHPAVAVDTKASVDEIAGNLNRDHARFKRECQRAQQDGSQLVILVENALGYTCIDDVEQWTNTHCLHCSHLTDCDPANVPSGKCFKHETRKLIQGPRLARSMRTMSTRYGVRFEFCSPRDAAKRVIDILQKGNNA